jgi:hypothetical protein
MAARVEKQAMEAEAGAAAGAGAGAGGGGAPEASLVALPDSLHLLIMGYIGSKDREQDLPLDRLAVSATAKDLLRLYGGRSERLRLEEQRGRDLDALRGFLCRQERLLELEVGALSLLPGTVSAIAAGGGRHLKKLKLGGGIGAESAMMLASLFIPQHNYLAALEELQIDWEWSDGPSFEVFLLVLGQGAAPRLRELTVGLGTRDAAVAMELLASALEARPAKGCAGLAVLELGGLDWTKDGPLDMRRRLWSVLLPTVEEILHEMNGSAQLVPFVDALLEQGAPCLRTLYDVMGPRLVGGLARLKHLEELTLSSISMETVAALEGAMEAAGGAGHFWPALRTLSLSFDEDGSIGTFMAWAGRTGAFPGLQRLEMYGEDLGALGAALTAGAFASLQELRFEAFRESEGMGGMEVLVQGLVAAPCARTLRSFEIIRDQSGGWFSSLGEAMGAGQLPVLTTLKTSDISVGDEIAVSFASSLTAVGSQALEVLGFDQTRIGDGGVVALALALQQGQLGARLKQLSFLESEDQEDNPHITNAAAAALAEALVAGKQFVAQLEELRMVAPEVTMEGARALVEAAVAHCPKLERVVLSSDSVEEEEENLEALRAIGRESGVRIDFW